MALASSIYLVYLTSNLLRIQTRFTLAYRKSVTTSPRISNTGVKGERRPVSHSGLIIPRNNLDGFLTANLVYVRGGRGRNCLQCLTDSANRETASLHEQITKQLLVHSLNSYIYRNQSIYFLASAHREHEQK